MTQLQAKEQQQKLGRNKEGFYPEALRQHAPADTLDL